FPAAGAQVDACREVSFCPEPAGYCDGRAEDDGSHRRASRAAFGDVESEPERARRDGRTAERQAGNFPGPEGSRGAAGTDTAAIAAAERTTPAGLPGLPARSGCV